MTTPKDQATVPSVDDVVPSRQVSVEYCCDLCQECRCTIVTGAEPPASCFDGDSVTCDNCGGAGRTVCNGLDNGDGTEGFDIVWTDPVTGDDYSW